MSETYGMGSMRDLVASQDGWLLGEQIASRILRLYADSFGSLDALLQEAGLSPVGWSSKPSALRAISPSALNDLCSRAVNRLAANGDMPDRPAALDRTDWRVILYCLAGARTLRDALARAADCFEAIDGRCGYLSLRNRPEGAELRLTSGRRSTMSVAPGVIDLYGVAEIHRLLGALIARPLPLRQICLEQPDRWLSELDMTRLPCPIVRDAGWTGFVFPAAYLDHPIVCSLDDLFAATRQSFLFQAEDPPWTGLGAADPVRRLALRALRDRQRLPPFEEVVLAVGSSAATLRRRLAAEGTSYREIKDSCRRELGLDLLRRSELSIEEISARLDFCDADAFRRAFQTWFGTAPSRYRRASRQSVSGEAPGQL